MDVVGWILIIGSALYLLVLAAAETYALVTGVDTISTRLRRLRETAPLAVVFALMCAGGLAVHFWG